VFVDLRNTFGFFANKIVGKQQEITTTMLQLQKVPKEQKSSAPKTKKPGQQRPRSVRRER
jgi:hypothetical protein